MQVTLFSHSSFQVFVGKKRIVQPLTQNYETYGYEDLNVCKNIKICMHVKQYSQVFCAWITCFHFLFQKRVQHSISEGKME